MKKFRDTIGYFDHGGTLHFSKLGSGATLTPLASFKSASERYTCFDIASESLSVVGTDNQSVHVLNIVSGNVDELLTFKISAKVGACRCVASNSSGLKIAASYDVGVRGTALVIWERGKGSDPTHYIFEAQVVLVWSPDNENWLAVATNTTLKVWDTTEKMKISEGGKASAEAKEPYAVRFSVARTQRPFSISFCPTKPWFLLWSPTEGEDFEVCAPPPLSSHRFLLLV